MAHHLVLGAGGVGRATATRLVELGHTVTIASRSGSVRERPWDALDPSAVTVTTADASDPLRLGELAAGATSIVNAINPPGYTTWQRDWPPVATATLTAARRTGAGLVIIGNLYGYGEVDAPMDESHPLRPAGPKGRLRATMWQEALAAHEAGQVRVTEVRSSDYVGPEATRGTSLLNDYVIRTAARGRPVLLPMGRPDAPHTWTAIADAGVLAATLATSEAGWGRAWHTPSAAPRTTADVARTVAGLAGREAPTLHRVPRPVLTAAGAALPLARELLETRHQFERPFVLDSTLTQRTFGLTPTPWEETLSATTARYTGPLPTTRT